MAVALRFGLQALYDMARKAKDEAGQLNMLRQLAKLDQHDRRVYGRLLALLLKRGHWQEATAIGESAIYLDVMNPQMHWLYGRALTRSGKHISAIYEFNSALLARPKPAAAAKIYQTMAEGYRKLKKPEWGGGRSGEAYRCAPKTLAPLPLFVGLGQEHVNPSCRCRR